MIQKLFSAKGSLRLRSLIVLALLTLAISASAIGSVNAALTWFATSNPSAGTDVANDVAVSATGVYVVGYDSVLGASNTRWRIERRNPANGALLAGPVAINPSAGNDVACGVAVDGTGVYVAGYDMVGGNARWRIEKRTLLGLAPIWVATSNPSVSTDVAYDVAVSSTGVYVVGYDRVLGNERWRIERRSLVTGALLVAPATSNPSVGTDAACAVAVDGTGVYVVGYDRFPGNERWRIEKRNLFTLAPIWWSTSNPSAGVDRAYGVAVGATGVYVVGYDRVLGDARWRIERRSPVNGALLVAPSTIDASAGDDIANGVAVGSTGIYVVGYDMAGGNARWRITKRNLFTLASIWWVANNYSAGTDKVMGVARDGTGIYAVGCDGAPGNLRWRIEKRTL